MHLPARRRVGLRRFAACGEPQIPSRPARNVRIAPGRVADTWRGAPSRAARVSTLSAAGPQEAVAADDPVVIAGVARVAYGPVEREGLSESLSKRLRHARERRDGNQGIGKALCDAPQMNIAGQHYVTGTYAPAGGLNSLAYAGRIYSDSPRFFEDTDPGALCCTGEAERVGQWIDLECTGKIDRLEIAARSKRIADPLHRPDLNCDSHLLFEEAAPSHCAVGVRSLEDIEPPLAFDDPDVTDFRDGIADILNAGQRQLPQCPGGRHADPLNDLFDLRRIARQHEAPVAAGRIPGYAARL